MSEKKISRTKKILLAILAVLVVLVIAVDIAGSNYLMNYAIGRSGDGGDRNVVETVFEEPEGTEARIEANRAAQALKTAEFLEQNPPQQVEIIASDGIRLAGFVYEHSNNTDDAASEPSEPGEPSEPRDQSDSSDSKNQSDQTFSDNCWAIVIHGYRGSHMSATALDMAQHYYDAGFNVLSPDLRASGKSEGDYVGMGWLDRLDILDWIDWILEQDPDAQIVIQGVSMGAATTMMLSGEETPEAVVAFVEDCGYTSVWDVFSSELSRRFGLPEFPLLNTASIWSSALAGYSFEEASALQAIAQSEKPMLFIHGTADDFIPFEMMGQLFEAKTNGDKEMLISEGAGHADSMYELSDVYWDTVFNFVSQYIK